MIICAVGVASKINDEIVVPEIIVDTPFSNDHFDEECRLKMVLIAHRLAPIKQNIYPSDISWLHLENPLPHVYLVGEDSKSYLLSCQASHHKREGAVLCPVSTEKGYGLVRGSRELKAPFSDYQNLTLREFLGIPRFNGSHVVHRMGRLSGLSAIIITFSYHPHPKDLKSLYEGSLCNGFPIGMLLYVSLN